MDMTGNRLAAELEEADEKVQRSVELASQIAAALAVQDATSVEALALEYMKLVQEVHTTVASAIVATSADKTGASPGATSR
jgi:hypothetical protein